MPVVPASELAQIALDVEDLVCDKSCAIWRKTPTKDAYGTETEVLSEIQTCNVNVSEPSAGQLQNYDYLIGSLAAWRVRMPTTANVQHQDHLVIDGSTMVVQVILAPKSYEVLRTVLATEVL